MSRRVSTKTFAIVSILVVLVIAGVLSWFASSHPDGLEYVAEEQGFDQIAIEHHASGGVFADYQTRGLTNERLSGTVAGVTGVAATGLVMGGVVLLLWRRSGTSPNAEAPQNGAPSKDATS